MNHEGIKQPACFGDLELVFPVGTDGLRHTPESCMDCSEKTGCLKTAMESTGGIKVREEKLNRAYESGRVGFWERWARKKGFWLDKKRKNESS